MIKKARKPLLCLTAATGIAGAVQAWAHLDDQQPMQSYRQSYFALLAMNFSPIAAMVKGESPWDQGKLKTFADELAALGEIDVARAFPPGSDKGTTRAKPGIWENPEDFRRKLDDLEAAIAQLQSAAGSGDRARIAGAVGDTGKTCKGCHDEYKSKDYLY